MTIYIGYTFFLLTDLNDVTLPQVSDSQKATTLQIDSPFHVEAANVPSASLDDVELELSLQEASETGTKQILTVSEEESSGPSDSVASVNGIQYNERAIDIGNVENGK